MTKIKTKENAKGTIKTLDKTAIASQRMKRAYIHTKDKTEHSVYSEESNVDEYAANKTENQIHSVVDKGNFYGNKIGHKSYVETKGKIKTAKENYKVRSLMKKQSNKSIKSIEKTNIDIKQSLEKSIKQTEKNIIKPIGKSVKTTEQTFKGPIKTSEHVLQATKQTSKATTTAMQRITKVSKSAGQNIKRGAKVTTSTVKAIIASTKALITTLLAGGWIAIVAILIVVMLGVALSIFGGGGSSDVYTPVSAQVEAYDPLIRQYAKEHEIPEYVELIKAVMMQESGGKGTDPMQASECGFNTKYPNTPNGITNAEYSINVGIQNLASCLKQAETENPVDMERIKLALQGYNYGNGYISWAKTTYGGYTVSNAIEFSNTKAQELGWDSYGDKQYVSHVLCYYPFGRAFTSGAGQAIVEIALTQEGNIGGEPYWSWYGFNSRVEWCACFISWCANEVGYIDNGLIPKFSGCAQGEQWFKDRSQWFDKTYEPQTGTIIFFDWEQDGTTDHVGIVVKYEDNKIYTIEGNSNDECKQNVYQYSSDVIYGYGVPAY